MSVIWMCRAGLLLVGLAVASSSSCAQDTPATAAAALPAMVQIEVVLAGLPADVTLPADVSDPAAALQKLRAQEPVAGQWIRQFQLFALSGSKATLQMGENQPVLSGYAIAGGRGGRSDAGGPSAVPSYSMMQTGTLVMLSPEVQADGTILLGASVESSRLSDNPPTTTAGDDLNLRPATSISTVSCTTRLSVTEGRTVLLRASQISTSGIEPSGHVLIFITARTQKP